MAHSHIQAVLEAEQRAAATIAQARTEAERLVSDARKEGLTALAAEETVARQERARAIAGLKVELEAERKRREARQQQEATKLTEKARKRFDPAIGIIIEQMRNA